jgi:uncharacterized protein YkwD
MLNADRFDASSMILRVSLALAATLAVYSPSQPPAANAAARATALDPARCAQAKLTPDARNLRAMRAATLCLINQERVLHGERPLRIDRRLQRSAQSHTQSMVAEGYFAHLGPHDDTLLRRIRASGYLRGRQLRYEIGENIGCGTLQQSTPYAIVRAWIASPPHLANILDSRFRDTGIGVAAKAPASACGGQIGATYTQDFGFVHSGVA